MVDSVAMMPPARDAQPAGRADRRELQGDMMRTGSGVFRCLAATIAVLAFCSGCGKESLSEKDVRSVCMNLGAGGWQSAMSVAKDAGMTDDAKAAAAVRKAAHDTCPAYTEKLQ